RSTQNSGDTRLALPSPAGHPQPRIRLGSGHSLGVRAGAAAGSNLVPRARRCAAVDRDAELLCKAKVVAVVPELRDLAVLETEDVDGGERRAPAGGFETAPRARVRPRRRPAPDDEVALADHEVDGELEIGERRPEVLGDLLLPGRPGQGIGS